jgi:hypothetical protein
MSVAGTQAIVGFLQLLCPGAEETVEPCGETKPLLRLGKID